MRKIATFQKETRTTFVYRDVENQEYVVRLYVDGMKCNEATYYTDAEDDALGTAELMVSQNE